MLVWEHPYYPYYYVPGTSINIRGASNKQTIKAGGQKTSGCLAFLCEAEIEGDDGHTRKIEFLGFERDGTAGEASLAGYVRLTFREMDHWLEEDTPIYVHPKDPFKRIDTMQSLRPIKISVDGQVLAESNFSVHLLEGSLPTRYYLPFSSVDPAILRRSNLETQCPYKGDAEYCHVVIGGRKYENLIWYYRLPTYESMAIAGMICFYNEKVDIELDGVKLERPKTKFG